MLETILLMFLALIICFWITCASKKVVLLDKQFKILWGSISILVALLAFNFVPNSILDWDLIRLYKHIDNIRLNGLNDALKYTEYRNLYIIKFWMGIVALTKCNGLFPAVPLLIEFLTFGFIVQDMLKNKYHSLPMQVVVPATFLWISMMGLKLSFSDVRCTLAMCLCCLGFYLEYINGRKRSIAIFLYICAVFTHHFTLLFIIIRLVLCIKKLVQSKYILLIASLLIQSTIHFAANYIYQNIEFDYLHVLAGKLLADWDKFSFMYYFSNREFTMKILYLCFIMVFLFGYLGTLKTRERIKNEKECKVNNAMYVLCCVGVGFSFNYLLLERLIYIAAYFFMIYYILVCSKREKTTYFIAVMPVLSYILFFNDINSFIVNALGYFYL